MAGSISEARRQREAALVDRMTETVQKAKALKERGHSNVTIARRLGLSESNVLAILRKEVVAPTPEGATGIK